jgi:hypothetical protein
MLHDTTMESKACNLLLSKKDIKAGFKYRGSMEGKKINKIK